MTRENEQAVKELYNQGINPEDIADEHVRPMTDNDYTLTRLRMQREVLLDLLKEYRGRTIDNIIDNINQRINYYESHT